jgi:glycerophosphoryl diester phosphodiesterase
MTELILHGASLDHSLPFGSLANLELSLKAGIPRIEVDVFPLKDGDFAMLHDPNLSQISQVSGSALELTAGQIQAVRYKGSTELLGTLSQAVALLKKYPVQDFLQLDLKPYAPLTMTSLQRLIQLIKPVQDKIMVSSIADWAVRIIQRISPTLRLGFDPLLYLDLVEEEPREEGIPPFRVGAYGYLDDHPLAAQNWGSLTQYFEARAEALIQQVPQGTTWFINATLLDESLQAGFDWIAFLHHSGFFVDAWTLDMDRAELAKKLAQTGVDYITSNQAIAMAEIIP